MTVPTPYETVRAVIQDEEFTSVYNKLMAAFAVAPTDSYLAYAINMMAQLSRNYGGHV